MVPVPVVRCDKDLMPALALASPCNSEEPCRPAYWVAEPWSACSTASSCGLGFEARTSLCMDAYGEVPGGLCSSITPPSEMQDCQVSGELEGLINQLIRL